MVSRTLLVAALCLCALSACRELARYRAVPVDQGPDRARNLDSDQRAADAEVMEMVTPDVGRDLAPNPDIAADASLHDSALVSNDLASATPDVCSNDVAPGGAQWTPVFSFRTTAINLRIEVVGTYNPGRIHWDFGTCATSLGYQGHHDYGMGGEKTVTLSVQDGGGVVITRLRGGSTQLVGPLPKEVGAMKDLVELSLSGNQLSGELPAELGDATTLETLNLSNNHFSGRIPPSIGQLARLETVWLNNNQLMGSIPTTVGRLKNVTYLDLASNALSGAIPDTIGDMTALVQLIAYKNKLSGPIPTSIKKLSRLKDLRIFDNNLMGTIPDMSELRSLETLNLNNNKLENYSYGAFRDLLAIKQLSLYGNLLPTTAVEAIIHDIYQDRNRRLHIPRTLHLHGAGMGTIRAGARAQVDELRDQFGWTIACNGC